MAVVATGEANASGFDEQTKLIRVCQWRLIVGSWYRPDKRVGLFQGNDRFIEGALMQADAALITLGQRVGRFRDNGHVKVSGQ